MVVVVVVVDVALPPRASNRSVSNLPSGSVHTYDASKVGPSADDDDDEDNDDDDEEDERE